VLQRRAGRSKPVHTAHTQASICEHLRQHREHCWPAVPCRTMTCAPKLPRSSRSTQPAPALTLPFSCSTQPPGEPPQASPLLMPCKVSAGACTVQGHAHVMPTGFSSLQLCHCLCPYPPAKGAASHTPSKGTISGVRVNCSPRSVVSHTYPPLYMLFCTHMQVRLACHPGAPCQVRCRASLHRHVCSVV
jgi:hypothetical protein